MTSVPHAANRPDTAGTRQFPIGIVLGLVVAILAVLAGSGVAYRLLEIRKEAAQRGLRETATLSELLTTVSAAKEVDRGVLRYLLTGDEAQLAPYRAAAGKLTASLEALQTLTAEDAARQQQIIALKVLARTRLREAELGLARRQSGGIEAAAALVASEGSTLTAERMRELTDELIAEQRRQLEQGKNAADRVNRWARMYIFGNAMALLLLVALGGTTALRSHRRRSSEAWVRAGQAGLASRIQGESRLDRLGEAALKFLASYTGADAGALYAANDEGGYRCIASHALNATLPRELAPSDQLIERLTQSGRSARLSVSKGDSLASLNCRELLIGASLSGGRMLGAIELGFKKPTRPEQLELLDSVSDLLGAALRSAMDSQRLNSLLDQSLEMAEEMHERRRELNANNIVLGEKSEHLRAAHEQLARQQTALEEVNTHLEEQMHVLENQKEELRVSQDSLAQKADELEKANRYKNSFLANMSHELRTPLNSALILSKLLAENGGGNLSEQQVSYAETIHSSGSDLLVLINDILDLAKIEAGKVDLHPERVPLAAMVKTLVRGFEPAAAMKSLTLSFRLDPELPETMVTDEARLGQILKNLLSNAIKFTRVGEIELIVSPGAHDTLRFAVRDSGIGVSSEQLEYIFEAFRQADGSTHREFGGTGLGLSISRELARLLGGEVSVQSTPGVGSVFTLELPQQLPGFTGREPVLPRRQPMFTETRVEMAALPASAATTENRRRILIVEDDVHFADILRDLGAEMGFEALTTQSGNQGFALAAAQAPTAILLDVNLPDQSGLVLLDRLKRDPRTRHIPVFMVSVADYRQDALQRGAVGYALKPVKREQLVAAFQQLEAKSAQGLRRVLLVEGDVARAQSLRALLQTGDVEIREVADAEAAMTALRTDHYDCVVLDLALPAAGGFALLEQMDIWRNLGLPPVIVYAAEALSAEQEQTLRRYSRSLVLKDARSPEHLLDEVTLFIHQVESRLPPEQQRLLKEVRNRDATLEGRHVLLVEDDPRNIFALSSVLEPKGIKVRIARNGREALTALEQSGPDNPVDLVLMDIMMPEMDGITATREIRKNPDWKRLPIIALTAKAMKDDQDACLAAGVNDYMAKPLDSDRLLSLIRVWMPK